MWDTTSNGTICMYMQAIDFDRLGCIIEENKGNVHKISKSIIACFRTYLEREGKHGLAGYNGRKSLHAVIRP